MTGAATVAGMSPAAAQMASVAEDPGSLLRLLAARLELTIARLPELVEHLARLPETVGGRTALLLAGIVVAGLAAEYAMRNLLRLAMPARLARTAEETGVRGFGAAVVFDLVALVALWIAARLMVAQIGHGGSVGVRLGHLVLLGLVYWRTFSLVFRAWLRPHTPHLRLVPVDNATARRLLTGLNLLVLLPLIAEDLGRALLITGASREAMTVAALFYVPAVSAGLLAVVWHWRNDLAAWLSAMVPQAGFASALKRDAARNWWIGGLVFYGVTALAEIYAALTENDGAARGMDVIETILIGLLLFETLMHRVTRHIATELPLAGDVVADCLRLTVRLYVAIEIAEAAMVRVLAAATPAEWVPHDRGAKVAALSAVAIYALWRFLSYRMDSYIAANPLPSADATGDGEEEVQVAASRLRTLMPLLRAVAAVTIAVVGTLLVLSELGINITPLIAGASVLGLAVSFGSQSLVRDVVSGVFFLAEDSFRIGEYVDCSKVKGTVESFSVRSLKLRHQNGQLHIVPFGQIAHITNFSRDWTVVKFNLAFAHGTDVELLRKTVKKIGIDMMAEPTFKPILLQPLKMQGVVDIKDSSLIVRFKFMARPKNPSMVQRMAIRRMYDAFPALGIQFAQPVYQFPIPATPPAPAPAVVKAAE